MTAISAHELLTTRDCVFPGCDREADRGGTTCRAHAAPTPPREQPAGATSPAQVAHALCRVDGCTTEQEETPTTSPYRGLCAAHREDMRARVSRRRKRQPSPPPPATPGAPPAPQPIASLVDGAARLGQLAVDLEAARARVRELEERVAAVIEELRGQVAA
jgi:hypothetical protein